MPNFHTIVVGAGAGGMMSAIISAREGRRVLLLEKLPSIGAKLKATGGGRCNLSNTLSNEIFMEHFGRDGRFMSHALELLNHHKLIDFFNSIGVQTDALDGFRIFPVGHNSQSIISALHQEMQRLGVEILCNQKVISLEHNGIHIIGIQTATHTFKASKVIIATGGMGYPTLGAEGDGYELAKEIGHSIKKLYPAMMPLKTKERWVASCTADTIPKVKLCVDLKKYKRLSAVGDLIFTKNGIRGPVVLDFSREITPLIDKFGEVPIRMNLTKGRNQEQIRQEFKVQLTKTPTHTTLSLMQTLLPQALSLELCHLANANPDSRFNQLSGEIRDTLISLLAWTPLTISGHDGFKMAMITRGGVALKEIDPKTMQSKKLKGVYFCGEVMDLDGPCGGYNLQWAFASGFVAGVS